MMRAGLEPTISEHETDVLPLNYLIIAQLLNLKVSSVGFEPTTLPL